MNAPDYFAMPGVNWSTLKHMRDSAKAYRYAVDIGMEDSDLLREGRLLHTLVLEPTRFDLDYIAWEGKVRHGKEWDAFAAAHADQCIVTPRQIDEAQAMAAAVLSSAEAMEYLGDRRAAQFEHTLQWTDAATGLKCKARADVLIPGRRVLADLKGCASIDARRFGLQSARLGYHCQTAHYSNGVTAARGWVPMKRKLIAVERLPPHDVAVFDVGDEDMEIAREEVAYLLGRVRECIESKTWPGRYTGEQALQLPSYITGGELEFEYE